MKSFNKKRKLNFPSNLEVVYECMGQNSGKLSNLLPPNSQLSQKSSVGFA